MGFDGFLEEMVVWGLELYRDFCYVEGIWGFVQGVYGDMCVHVYIYMHGI